MPSLPVRYEQKCIRFVYQFLTATYCQQLLNPIWGTVTSGIKVMNHRWRTNLRNVIIRGAEILRKNIQCTAPWNRIQEPHLWDFQQIIRERKKKKTKFYYCRKETKGNGIEWRQCHRQQTNYFLQPLCIQTSHAPHYRYITTKRRIAGFNNTCSKFIIFGR